MHKTRYLNTPEAVRLTGLSRGTLDYLRAEGDLPFYRPAKTKRILFREDELRAFLERYRVDVRNAGGAK